MVAASLLLSPCPFVGQEPPKPLDGSSNIGGYYVGTVGGESRLQVDLPDLTADSAGSNSFSGMLFYEGAKQNEETFPDVFGRFESGEIVLERIDEEERPTETFIGAVNEDGTFRGTRIGGESEEPTPFELVRVAQQRSQHFVGGESFWAKWIEFTDAAGGWQVLNPILKKKAAENAPSGPAEDELFESSYEQSVAYFSEVIVCLHETNSYEGGAHPNTFWGGICYQRQGDTPRILDLRSVFVQKVVEYIGDEPWEDEGAAKKLRAEQVSDMWFSGLGLVSCISRDGDFCQVMRSFRYEVPFSELRGWVDANTPLGRWLAGR